MKETVITFNWETDQEKIKKQFLKSINKIQIQDIKYLVVNADTYYVQYAGGPKIDQFYCEAMSNEFLTGDNKIKVQEVEKLLNLNFIEPNSKKIHNDISKNYSKLYTSSSKNNVEKMYEELVFIMNDVYQIKSNELIQLHFQ